MKCTKFILLFVTLNIAGRNSQAQLQMETNSINGSFATKNLVPASPAAAGFAKYGQSLVNNFTGAPFIDIPLHSINYKELGIGISLSYQSGNGIKPDAMPGSTGLGWMLNNGGAITRISKGIIPVAFPNPEAIDANSNPTSDNDWSSNTNMGVDISYPKYMTNNNCQYDEFSFSFCGMSGKFYTDYSNVQHFKSQQGEDLKVEMELTAQKQITLPLEPQVIPFTPGGSFNTYANHTTLWNSPYKFTITDSKGIKYIFGGTDESLELVRTGRSLDGTTYTIEDNFGKNTEAITWYLTAIQSPNGYNVDLTYQRGQFYTTTTASHKSLYTQFGSGTLSGIPTARLISSSLINPVYLQKITTPESVTAFFYSSAANQLGRKFHVINDLNITSDDPNLSFDDHWCDVHFHMYPDVCQANVDDRFAAKLDYFTVSDKYETMVKKVVFNYTNSTATRLKLTSVELRGKDDNGGNAQVYSFEYNSQSLPAYLSFEKDTYGYYNGVNTYITSNNPTDYYNNFQNSTWRTNYLASRAPNETYAKAEILEKIIYPAGGYSFYEYESNQCGRIAQNWPASITETISGSESTGGLRIKTISNYDFTSHKAGEKKFYYIKNYASGVQSSSGVLNYVPIFWEFYNGPVNAPASPPYGQPFPQNLDYKNWGTEPLNPMSYNKSSHITYSEVAEVDMDGGFVVHKYKNYDNGYPDRPALNAVYDNKETSDLWKEDDMNSMEGERGQILSDEVYDNNSFLKKKVSYEYDDASSRFLDDGNNIRILKCIPNPVSSLAFHISLRYTATLAYTYFPFLKTKTEVLYENGGSATTAINYTYGDGRLLKKQEATSSNADVFSVVNKYPTDMVSDGTTIPYQAMVDAHIINPVIVQQNYKNTSTFLNSVTANYKNWSGTVFSPETMQTKNASNSAETRFQIYRTDAKGNVLEQGKANDITHEVYIWGYNGQYLVAKILGSTYNTASLYINQAMLDDAGNTALYTDDDIRTELNNLRINLGTAKVITLTYSPLLGITSQTDPNGKTTYYEYDNMGRLSIVRDNDKNILKRICYNYAGQPEACISVPTALPGQTIYARLSYENAGFLSLGVDVVARFYSDAACTQPVVVVDMPLNWTVSNSCGNLGGVLTPIPLTPLVTGYYYVIDTFVTLSYYWPQPCFLPPQECPHTICYVDYVLAAGDYTIIQ